MARDKNMNFWNVQSALSRLSSSLRSRSDLILQVSIVLAFCAGAMLIGLGPQGDDEYQLDCISANLGLTRA